MNLIQELAWKALGRAATIVVEEYDDTADAIIALIVSAGMTTAFVYATYGLAVLGPVAGSGRATHYAAIVFLILLSILGLVAFGLHVLAAVMYATEPTELPTEAEGIR